MAKANFETAEKKIVFRVSRIFFWILVAMGGLVFVSSVLVFLYSIIPPSKEKVVLEDFPQKPDVTIAEVMEALKPKVVQEVYKAPEVVKEITPPPPPDPLTQKLNNLMDSLAVFFPGKWEPVYERRATRHDWFGRPVEWGRFMVREGMKYYVQELLSRFDEKELQISLVQKMIELCKNLEEEKRGTGIKTLVNILNEKIQDYNYQIHLINARNDERLSSAELMYNQDRNEKKLLSEKAQIGIGGSIVAVALLGLVLCFLAIERNTRAIRDLIEKEEKK